MMGLFTKRAWRALANEKGLEILRQVAYDLS